MATTIPIGTLVSYPILSSEPGTALKGMVAPIILPASSAESCIVFRALLTSFLAWTIVFIPSVAIRFDNTSNSRSIMVTAFLRIAILFEGDIFLPIASPIFAKLSAFITSCLVDWGTVPILSPV